MINFPSLHVLGVLGRPPSSGVDYEVHTQIKRGDEGNSDLPSYRSKWFIYKCAIPIVFPNFIMGLSWCIFNESFKVIDNEMNIKGNWDESIFYGSINGLFVLGCLVGTIFIPGFLKKPKGVAIETKGDHVWFGNQATPSFVPDEVPKINLDLPVQSNEFHLEMKKCEKEQENHSLNLSIPKSYGSLEKNSPDLPKKTSFSADGQDSPDSQESPIFRWIIFLSFEHQQANTKKQTKVKTI